MSKISLKTTIELPIAHCLDDAYSGLCTGLVGINENNKFSNVIPVVHGHNYNVTVELFTDTYRMNEDCMIMDFKLIKKRLHEFFDKYDHSLILTENNPLTTIYKESYEKAGIDIVQTRIFIWDNNPTAEYMCIKWQQELKQLFNNEYLINLTVEETSHNSCTLHDI